MFYSFLNWIVPSSWIQLCHSLDLFDCFEQRVNDFKAVQNTFNLFQFLVQVKTSTSFPLQAKISFIGDMV